MKRRKSLLLSKRAITLGERVAAQSGKSLSALVEEQLLALPSPETEAEEFWTGPALKPLRRCGDARSEFLRRKHG